MRAIAQRLWSSWAIVASFLAVVTLASAEPTAAVSPEASPVASPEVVRPTSWTVTDLGGAGRGNESLAYGINADGMVAGTDFVEPERLSANSRAAVYRDGAWQVLPDTRAGAVGDAINARGDVAGFVTMLDADGQPRIAHPALWRKGKLLDLGTLGGNAGIASSVNDKNRVVGSSTTGTEIGAPNHAFLWKSGKMTDLGLLPEGNAAMALGINNREQVVGTAEAGQGQTHAVLSEHGHVTDLGTLPGGEISGATAIDDGQIVGYSPAEPGIANVRGDGVHAVRWDHGTIVDLGPLRKGRHALAADVDSAGDVVGAPTTKPVEQDIHAVLWRDGEAINLNSRIAKDSGWVLLVANGINEAGQIVGHGTIDVHSHGFLLTAKT
jgi:probable HAF family extracellular repeat protein